MDSGLYVAYAGLLARSASLDNAASNLANAGTSGFRAQREYFHGGTSGDSSFTSALGRSLNNFSVLGGSQVSESQGEINLTGRSLDLAIEGPGFFGVSGKGGLMMTRNGDIVRATDGTLRLQGGETLVSETGKEIVVPVGNVSVGADGTVSVDGYVIDKVAVFDPPSDRLVPTGTALYLSKDKTQPRTVTAPNIRAGALEASNQNEVQGSVNLVQVERQAENLQKAVSLFSDSFDKTAAQELPRI